MMQINSLFVPKNISPPNVEGTGLVLNSLFSRVLSEIIQVSPAAPTPQVLNSHKVINIFTQSEESTKAVQEGSVNIFSDENSLFDSVERTIGTSRLNYLASISNPQTSTTNTTKSLTATETSQFLSSIVSEFIKNTENESIKIEFVGEEINATEGTPSGQESLTNALTELQKAVESGKDFAVIIQSNSEVIVISSFQETEEKPITIKSLNDISASNKIVKIEQFREVAPIVETNNQKINSEIKTALTSINLVQSDEQGDDTIVQAKAVNESAVVKESGVEKQPINSLQAKLPEQNIEKQNISQHSKLSDLVKSENQTNTLAGSTLDANKVNFSNSEVINRVKAAQQNQSGTTFKKEAEPFIKVMQVVSNKQENITASTLTKVIEPVENKAILNSQKPVEAAKLSQVKIESNIPNLNSKEFSNPEVTTRVKPEQQNQSGTTFRKETEPFVKVSQVANNKPENSTAPTLSKVTEPVENKASLNSQRPVEAAKLSQVKIESNISNLNSKEFSNSEVTTHVKPEQQNQSGTTYKKETEPFVKVSQVATNKPESSTPLTLSKVIEPVENKAILNSQRPVEAAKLSQVKIESNIPILNSKEFSNSEVTTHVKPEQQNQSGTTNKKETEPFVKVSQVATNKPESSTPSILNKISEYVVNSGLESVRSAKFEIKNSTKSEIKKESKSSPIIVISENDDSVVENSKVSTNIKSEKVNALNRVTYNSVDYKDWDNLFDLLEDPKASIKDLGFNTNVYKAVNSSQIKPSNTEKLKETETFKTNNVVNNDDVVLDDGAVQTDLKNILLDNSTDKKAIVLKESEAIKVESPVQAKPTENIQPIFSSNSELELKASDSLLLDPSKTLSQNNKTELAQKISQLFDNKTFEKVFRLVEPKETSRIVETLANGKQVHSLELKLTPRELGSVKVILEMQNNSIDAKIEVNTEYAKNIIVTNLHQLKDSLLEQGIIPNSINIQLTNDNQKQSHGSSSKKKFAGSNKQKNDSMIQNEITVKNYGYNTYEYIA